MPEIRKGSSGTVEGGARENKGDGGNVTYPKRDGSADHAAGAPKVNRHGRDKSIGR